MCIFQNINWYFRVKQLLKMPINTVNPKFRSIDDA